MIITNPQDYKFLRFEKSKTKHKKYDAILLNKKTQKEKRVPFGQLTYQHYKDNALGIYSNLNHGDKKRRDSYRSRHKGELENKFSSGYFAWKYLW